jgi:hypothetical protein
VSFLGRLGVLLALLVVAAFLVGCGETVIDSTKAEDALQANLTKSLETKVTSVDCPSDQKVEAGTTFTCTVNLAGGKTDTATLRIRNDNADISLVDLQGEVARANE